MITLTTREDRQLSYWLAFGIPVVLMLLVMLISGSEPFFGRVSMLYSDMYHQYFPFWVEFGRAIRSGDGLLWNWAAGLGMDYLSLISYYLASPLNLISVIVPESIALEVYSLLMPVKLGFASLFFAIFLHKTFKKSDISISLFGAMYGLCGWAVAYQWNIMWLDTFAEKERAYVMKFYLTGVFAIVMEWLDKNCSDDMATVIKVITDCVMGERNING